VRAKLLALPLIAGISLLAIVAVTWTGQARELSTTSDLIAEYPVPFTDGNPFNLAVESDGGRIWFSMPDANAIGRLIVTSTQEYQFTQFDVPTPDSKPYDLAYDGEAIWFTESEANQIGRLDVSSGEILEFAIPLSPTISITDSSPAGIDVAPSGDIWFAERAANSISRFDPETAVFNRYVYSFAGALPEEIIAGDDEKIWFTAPGGDRVVQYLVNIDFFASVPVSLGPGQPFLPPGGLALDNSGDPWATSPEEDMIGAYLPATFSFWRWYRLPGPGIGPTAVAYSRDNVEGTQTLWYVGSEGGLAGSLTINSFASVVHQSQIGMSSADSYPTDIVIDTDGLVWIADYGGSMIVEWSPPYYYDVRMPLLVR
jgi:streptogramin lyase